MIVQNIAHDGTTDFTFTVHRNEFKKALEILRATAAALGAREAEGDDKIVKISLVGVGCGHTPASPARCSSPGRRAHQHPMISTSEIKVSVVVDEKYLELGVAPCTRPLDSTRTATAETERAFDPAKGVDRIRVPFSGYTTRDPRNLVGGVVQGDRSSG